MEDMAPALIEKIQKDFERRMKAEPEIAKLLQGIVDGSRSYTDALNLGDELGAVLSDAVAAGLANGVLPDDTLYYNIARRLIDQVGGGAFDLAQDAAVQVQENINREAGLGLAAISPDTKAGRLDDLVNTVAGKPLAECLPDIKSAMRTLPQGAVSDTMQANMEFQGKAGLRARIVRTYHEGKHYCKYCAERANTYEYPVKNTEVYRRHPNCRCKLEYITGKKSKTLWSSGDKAQQRAQEKAKEARIEKYNALTAAEKKKVDARAAAREKLQVAHESDKLKENIKPKILSIETSSTTGSGAWSHKTKEHLLQSERIISGNQYEIAIWYSSDGTTHWSKKGSAREVEFTRKEVIKMKGGILTHNHPDGTVFSPEDIGMFSNASLTEMRACNSRGAYVLKKSASNFSGYETLKSLSTKHIQKEYWDSMHQVEAYYADLAAKEGKPIFLYMQQMDEAGLTRFCEKYGLDFTWEGK